MTTFETMQTVFVLALFLWIHIYLYKGRIDKLQAGNQYNSIYVSDIIWNLVLKSQSFLNSINNIMYRCIFTTDSSISNQRRKAENKECLRHVCVYIHCLFHYEGNEFIPRITFCQCQHISDDYDT